jgi:hypothetical protein
VRSKKHQKEALTGADDGLLVHAAEVIGVDLPVEWPAEALHLAPDLVGFFLDDDVLPAKTERIVEQLPMLQLRSKVLALDTGAMYSLDSQSHVSIQHGWLRREQQAWLQERSNL